jgi:hypothetical protein
LIKEQPRMYVSATRPSPPPLPLASCISFSVSCVSAVEITDGREGWARNQIIRSQGSLAQEVKHGVRSPKFICATCAQMNSLAETPQPLPPFPIFGAIGQPRLTTSLCDPLPGPLYMEINQHPIGEAKPERAFSFNLS